ncbi:hypothetical protein KSF_003950 [Reticulibacter mediterranei]|uniref:Uncharacterized protein n=1 Tax=Reticulibacter mediterranei TaxID=2778369 RepID=A0A8J3N0J6_9CHLR|nr:hypothetical protein [Reticulibacter mediterranei]GHO90347.1 hypothetical protein KSF_003950 [Reticulibacter mediterranei]
MSNPNVLTIASTIDCPHTGQVTFSTDIKHKLKVQGNPVLLKSDIENAPVSAACTNQDNPPSTRKCTKVSSVTGGESTKLKVGGVPVILSTVTGFTDGFPPLPSLLTGITPVQSKLVVAVS